MITTLAVRHIPLGNRPRTEKAPRRILISSEKASENRPSQCLCFGSGLCQQPDCKGEFSSGSGEVHGTGGGFRAHWALGFKGLALGVSFSFWGYCRIDL